MDTRVLLTMEAAAERLSITRTRAYELGRSGELRTVKVGRLRRVPTAAITEYVERLRAEQSAA